MDRLATVALSLCSLLCVHQVSSYPSGAPPNACTSMTPTGHGTAAQDSPEPYWLEVDTNTPIPGQIVTVTLNGGNSAAQIRGILLQARTLDTNEIVGEFVGFSADFKGIDCSGANSALTHNNRDDKPLPVTFSWRANTEVVIKFTATVVRTKEVYWMNVNSPTVSVSACSASQTLSASDCAITFLQEVGQEIGKVYSFSLDVVSLCSSVEDLHNTFTNCTADLPAGCAPVYSSATEFYQNTTTEFCNCEVSDCTPDPCSLSPQPTCPEAQAATCVSYLCADDCWAVWVDENQQPVQCSTSSECGFDEQLAIYTCAQTFASKYDELLQSKSLGADICSGLEAALIIAYECLDPYMLDCGNTEAYIFTNQSLSSATCKDTEDVCGLLPLQRCFANFPSEPAFPASCGSFINVTTCVDEYKLNCGEVDLDDVFQPGMTASLDTAKDFCEKFAQCPDFENRLEVLEQCMTGVVLPTTLSFNSFCSYMGTFTQCILDQLDCEVLGLSLMPSLNQLRDFIGVFNCQLTFGENTFQPMEGECNLESMVGCASPVIEALDLPPLDRDTDLQSYLNTALGVPFDLSQPITDDMCNPIRQSSAVDCYITESLKCYDFLSNTLPPNQYAYSGIQLSGSEQLPNISVSDIGASLSPVSSLIQSFDQTSASMELRCDEECENTTPNLLAFGLCVSPEGFTIDNFAAELSMVFQTVIERHNSKQSFTSECRKLDVVKTCVESHLVGCPYTESIVSTLLSSPADYQVLGLCDISFNFKIKDTSIACVKEEFVEKSLTAVHRTCDASALSKESIQDLTDSLICSKLEARLMCLSSPGACCEVIQQTLLPTFHTVALLNQELSCDIRVPRQGIKITPSDGCDYVEVLRCYLPLLNRVGIYSIDVVSRSILTKIVSLKENFPINQCLTESAMSDIQSCVQEASSQCTFPAICDSDQSESSHLPLDDLIGFKHISNLCDAACVGLPSSQQNCFTPASSALFNLIGTSDLTGADVQAECQEISLMMECVNASVGSCSVEITKARTQLSWQSSSFLRLVNNCDLDVQFLQLHDSPDETDNNEPSSTVDTDPNTTIVTLGGAGLKVEMSVLIGAAVCWFLYQQLN